jgi:uncharacterized membrane protein
MTALALASAMSGALAMASSVKAGPIAFDDATQEKCYGIALKGHNDCAAAGVHECAGLSKVSYEKGSWKAVPKGTCASMHVHGHMGHLAPT